MPGSASLVRQHLVIATVAAFLLLPAAQVWAKPALVLRYIGQKKRPPALTRGPL
jgi:hypothetical protein